VSQLASDLVYYFYNNYFDALMMYIMDLLQNHDALEHRVSARASVRNYLKRTRHSVEFRMEEHLGLIRGRIHRWIVKAFDCLALRNARCKFEREFDVELHGMDDDRELMA
jgi:hypothetical protein